MEWTKPYHGVTHLTGLKKGYRVTVNEVGNKATCKVATPERPFSADEVVLDSVDAAKEYGESQAAELGILDRLPPQPDKLPVCRVWRPPGWSKIRL